MNKQEKTAECPIIKLNMASVSDIGKAMGSIYSGGVWWKKIRKGFWWPLDFTQPVEIGTTPPKMRYFGYQHLNFSGKANSHIKYMLIEDLQNYNIQSLKSSCRRNIRESLRSLEFKIITDFNEKEAEQAANCWNDLVERTKWRQRMDVGKFSAYWKSLLSMPGHTLIGAYHDGQLIGWLIGIFFDNGNCYLPRYASLKDFFNLRVNNGLIYTFLVSARESAARTANFGLFIPDNPELDRFKETMGFKETSLPAYTYINPIVKPIIRRFFKSEIGRLTGW